MPKHTAAEKAKNKKGTAKGKASVFKKLANKFKKGKGKGKTKEDMKKRFSFGKKK